MIFKFTLFALLAIVAGCTTMQPVIFSPQDGFQQHTIKPGDRLKLVTLQGKEKMVTVSAISDSAILSQDDSI